uniref:Pseudouridine synthase RsuA/RluA-like domain-containing protein n=1 Tax=Opuntia streptacantha TaxID=393608 RepID=A0A7C9CD17_OPUST
MRRVLCSPATSANTAVLLDQKFFHATTAICSPTIQEETKKLKEKEAGKRSSKGKWVTLPLFNTTIDSNSLGKRLTGEGNEPIESTTTALKWVLRCCPHLPRSLVQKLFRLRQVRRECFKEGNSGHDAGSQECQLKRVAAKDLIRKGDQLLLPITVKESHAKKHGCQCSEEEMSYIRSLELHKDSSIIAINKPPKLPVQGGHGIKKSLDELAATCLRYDYDDPPRLVHRLDRDSSGILVMGRTQTSTSLLHSIFREKTFGVLDDKEITWRKRTLQKRYLALVFGVPRQLKGLISAPLTKVVLDDGKSERITVADHSSSSQHAVTEYRVIETSYGYTWLELSPITGRKHQLRVHCAEVLGTPIVGDYKYGWHAHRKWKPLSPMKPSPDKKLEEEKLNALGLDLECGSIAEKQPHLHLHCKQMILPNISMALQHASSPDSDYDFSKLETLNLVAPLPSHMQRSWNLHSSVAKLGQCE